MDAANTATTKVQMMMRDDENGNWLPALLRALFSIEGKTHRPPLGPSGGVDEVEVDVIIGILLSSKTVIKSVISSGANNPVVGSRNNTLAAEAGLSSLILFAVGLSKKS